MKLAILLMSIVVCHGGEPCDIFDLYEGCLEAPLDPLDRRLMDLSRPVFNTACDLEPETSDICLGSKEEWSNLQKQCVEETFEIRVYVTSHIRVVAIPGSNQDSSCPVIVLEDGLKFGKVAHSWGEAFDESELDIIRKHTGKISDGLSIAELAAAFEGAKYTEQELKRDDGTHEVKPYSLVSNNCATFLLSILFEHLHIEPTEEVMEYVIDRLVANGVGEKILKSSEIDALGASDAEKENMIAMTQLLVNTYIQNFKEEAGATDEEGLN